MPDSRIAASAAARLVAHRDRVHGALLLFFALWASVSVAFPSAARAHELRPAIADLTLESGELAITLRVNLEALIAGIGAEHDDTDAAPAAPEYDRLRALSAERLRDEADRWSPALLRGVMLDTGQGELAAIPSRIEVPVTGDVRVARDSFVTLTAAWPPAADSLRIGWAEDFGALIVRAGPAGPASFSQYLLPGDVSDAIAASTISQGSIADGESAMVPTGDVPPTRTLWAVAVDYVRVGFVHIVPRGLDHILFVVGLFLLAPRVGALAWQISAFTLAHSFTLAAGTLGWVSVPASIVEPLIALSIVLVAAENLFSTGLHARRLVLVFGFGLLHGLGFASVLGEAGLSESRFLLSLFAFNAGVEIGQLCVVAVCFALVGWFRDAPGYRRVVIVPGSLCVGAVGLFWFAQRLV